MPVRRGWARRNGKYIFVGNWKDARRKARKAAPAVPEPKVKVFLNDEFIGMTTHVTITETNPYPLPPPSPPEKRVTITIGEKAVDQPTLPPDIEKGAGILRVLLLEGWQRGDQEQVAFANKLLREYVEGNGFIQGRYFQKGNRYGDKLDEDVPEGEI